MTTTKIRAEKDMGSLDIYFVSVYLPLISIETDRAEYEEHGEIKGMGVTTFYRKDKFVALWFPHSKHLVI
jgi:hypothetical protein